jgi:hypothetical protein
VNDKTKIDAFRDSDQEHALRTLLRQAKALAVEYYKLTKKPLGVTGEVAEYEAAEKLHLTLAGARMPFFDAFHVVEGKRETFQIKGRAISAIDRYRGRVPKVKCDGDFDAVLLVLLDKSTFDAIEIWRAERSGVMARLAVPGSKARNERGSMGIAQFKSILGARRIWPPE